MSDENSFILMPVLGPPRLEDTGRLCPAGRRLMNLLFEENRQLIDFRREMDNDIPEPNHFNLPKMPKHNEESETLKEKVDLHPRKNNNLIEQANTTNSIIPNAKNVEDDFDISKILNNTTNSDVTFPGYLINPSQRNIFSQDDDITFEFIEENNFELSDDENLQEKEENNKKNEKETIHENSYKNAEKTSDKHDDNTTKNINNEENEHIIYNIFNNFGNRDNNVHVYRETRSNVKENQNNNEIIFDKDNIYVKKPNDSISPNEDNLIDNFNEELDHYSDSSIKNIHSNLKKSENIITDPTCNVNDENINRLNTFGTDYTNNLSNLENNIEITSNTIVNREKNIIKENNELTPNPPMKKKRYNLSQFAFVPRPIEDDQNEIVTENKSNDQQQNVLETNSANTVSNCITISKEKESICNKTNDYIIVNNISTETSRLIDETFNANRNSNSDLSGKENLQINDFSIFANSSGNSDDFEITFSPKTNIQYSQSSIKSLNSDIEIGEVVNEIPFLNQNEILGSLAKDFLEAHKKNLVDEQNKRPTVNLVCTSKDNKNIENHNVDEFVPPLKHLVQNNVEQNLKKKFIRTENSIKESLSNKYEITNKNTENTLNFKEAVLPEILDIIETTPKFKQNTSVEAFANIYRKINQKSKSSFKVPYKISKKTSTFEKNDTCPQNTIDNKKVLKSNKNSTSLDKNNLNLIPEAINSKTNLFDNNKNDNIFTNPTLIYQKVAATNKIDNKPCNNLEIFNQNISENSNGTTNTLKENDNSGNNKYVNLSKQNTFNKIPVDTVSDINLKINLTDNNKVLTSANFDNSNISAFPRKTNKFDIKSYQILVNVEQNMQSHNKNEEKTLCNSINDKNIQKGKSEMIYPIIPKSTEFESYNNNNQINNSSNILKNYGEYRIIDIKQNNNSNINAIIENATAIKNSPNSIVPKETLNKVTNVTSENDTEHIEDWFKSNEQHYSKIKELLDLNLLANENNFKHKNNGKYNGIEINNLEINNEEVTEKKEQEFEGTETRDVPLQQDIKRLKRKGYTLEIDRSKPVPQPNRKQTKITSLLKPVKQNTTEKILSVKKPIQGKNNAQKDIPSKKNESSEPKKPKISDHFPIIKRNVDKAKDNDENKIKGDPINGPVSKYNKRKQKFFTPLLSQVEEKFIQYQIYTLDDNMCMQLEKYLIENRPSEIGFDIIYREDCSLLNHPRSNNILSNCPTGLMISICWRTAKLNKSSFIEFYYMKLSKTYWDSFLTPKSVLKVCLTSNCDKLCFKANSFFSLLLNVFSFASGEISCIFFDPHIGCWLLDPDHPPTSFQGVQTQLNVRPNYKITSNDVLEISCDMLLQLSETVQELKKTLEDKHLWRVFEDMEMKVVSILAVMEHHGISVDLNELKHLAIILKQKLEVIEKKAYQIVGRKFQINSTVQLRTILYDELKLDAKNNIIIKETSTLGAKSTCEPMLNLLRKVHPLPGLVLEYRHLHKAKSTFVDSIIQHTKNGFIYCTWDQIAAATGRIAANNPNLQAIPKHPFPLAIFPENAEQNSIEILNLRSPYNARPGYTLLAADFQHIELRVFAHLSQDEKIIAALNEPGDIFVTLARTWLGNSTQEISKECRERTKKIVYAIMYGAGYNKLADILSISVAEAARIIRDFSSKFPSLREFSRYIMEQCRMQGYLISLSGRRRLFPNINSPSFGLKSQSERQAANFVIQGSAADICKAAMISTTERLKGFHSRLLLQIHDELVWEVADEELEKVKVIVKEVMEDTNAICGKFIKFAVPFPVSITCGKNWGKMT